MTTLLFLPQVISFLLTECWSKEMTWRSMSHHWPESLTKSRKLQIGTPCYCLVGCQSVKGQIHSEWCCVSLHLHQNRKMRIVFSLGGWLRTKYSRISLRIPVENICFCCVRLPNIAYLPPRVDLQIALCWRNFRTLVLLAFSDFRNILQHCLSGFFDRICRAWNGFLSGIIPNKWLKTRILLILIWIVTQSTPTRAWKRLYSDLLSFFNCLGAAAKTSFCSWRILRNKEHHRHQKCGLIWSYIFFYSR